ncbi:hypothetical protein GRJ2_000287200 [Grus japonensis]|uniref:Uncharacterized protein n=1 Tax=Grus japonensis TaxID=30415 RepID=A0ABC9VXW6_GRUJA
MASLASSGLEGLQGERAVAGILLSLGAAVPSPALTQPAVLREAAEVTLHLLPGKDEKPPVLQVPSGEARDIGMDSSKSTAWPWDDMRESARLSGDSTEGVVDEHIEAHNSSY